MSAVDAAVRPGARALAEPQPQRSPRRSSRASSWRRGRARPAAPRRPRSRARPRPPGGSTCPESSVDCTDRQAARTASSSSSKAIRPAARPSRAATARGRRSCRCAARCMNTEGMTLGEGAREQGARRPRRPRSAAASGKNFDLGRLRYGRDHRPGRRRLGRPSHRHAAAHVHLPPPAAARLANGKVFVAQPPLYRIDIGKETLLGAGRCAQGPAFWKRSAERASDTRTSRASRASGEMMPKVLWETTLNPRTRRLLRVEIADQIVTDRVINELMGKDAVRAVPLHHGPRRRGAGAGRLSPLAETDESVTRH